MPAMIASEAVLRESSWRWLRDPEFIGFGALWLFVFAIPWEYQVAVPFVGTVSRLFGGIAVVVGLATIIITGRIRLPDSLLVSVGLFFGWACLTFAWSIDPEASRVRIGTDCQLFIMIALVWRFAYTVERHMQLLQAYVCGSYISALTVINNGIYRRESTIDDPLRYTAGAFGPNELAITLAWTAPLALYLAEQKQRGLSRVLYRLHLPVIVLANILTGSRGGAITLIVSLSAVVAFIIRATAVQRTRWLLSLAAATTAAAILVPHASWERLLTIRSQVQTGSFSHRGDIWRAGWETLDAQSLIRGIGSAAYARKMANVLGLETGSHNSFLSLLVDNGAIGLGLFLSAFLLMCRHVWRMRGISRITWSVILASWLVGVTSMNGEAFKATWLLFSFIGASAALNSKVADTCAV
jgi:O-antigen ligase